MKTYGESMYITMYFFLNSLQADISGESRTCVIPVVCVYELRLACSLTQLCQYMCIY